MHCCHLAATSTIQWHVDRCVPARVAVTYSKVLLHHLLLPEQGRELRSRFQSLHRESRETVHLGALHCKSHFSRLPLDPSYEGSRDVYISTWHSVCRPIFGYCGSRHINRSHGFSASLSCHESGCRPLTSRYGRGARWKRQHDGNVLGGRQGHRGRQSGSGPSLPALLCASSMELPCLATRFCPIFAITEAAL